MLSFSSRTIASEENCPLTIKFPLKIIAPTQANSPKKITYFLKNHVASLFTLFENVFAICKFLPPCCLDVRFWNPLYFICLKFNPQFWYLLLCREKICWFSSCFSQEKGRNFCGNFTKSQKLCFHEIFNIG